VRVPKNHYQREDHCEPLTRWEAIGGARGKLGRLGCAAFPSENLRRLEESEENAGQGQVGRRMGRGGVKLEKGDNDALGSLSSKSWKPESGRTAGVQKSGANSGCREATPGIGAKKGGGRAKCISACKKGQ